MFITIFSAVLAALITYNLISSLIVYAWWHGWFDKEDTDA